MENLPNLDGFRPKDFEFIVRFIKDGAKCFWDDLDDSFVIAWNPDDYESPLIPYAFHVIMYTGPIYEVLVFCPRYTTSLNLDRDSENLWDDCLAMVKSVVDQEQQERLNKFLKNEGLI